MTQILDALVNLLTLERIEENLFRGASQDLGFPQLFGGQVLGQVISAASQTVTPERHVHSLHGYFLRPGDSHQPVVYDVDRVRDGGSFTTRRVSAIQKGQTIFTGIASFQPRNGLRAPVADAGCDRAGRPAQRVGAAASFRRWCRNV